MKINDLDIPENLTSSDSAFKIESNNISRYKTFLNIKIFFHHTNLLSSNISRNY